jgi:hypothetical protein
MDIAIICLQRQFQKSISASTYQDREFPYTINLDRKNPYETAVIITTSLVEVPTM